MWGGLCEVTQQDRAGAWTPPHNQQSLLQVGSPGTEPGGGQGLCLPQGSFQITLAPPTSLTPAGAGPHKSLLCPYWGAVLPPRGSWDLGPGLPVITSVVPLTLALSPQRPLRGLVLPQPPTSWLLSAAAPTPL